MILETIQNPTISILKVMNALALHAQTLPGDDTILIDPTSTQTQREQQESRPLASHLALHGLEAEGAQHAEFMRLQGWTHFVSDGVQKWVVHRDTPSWIEPHYLLPRCLNCAANGLFECRCGDRARPGKKARREYVYILQQETPGHFYVGRSKHPECRMEKHEVGKGVPWTRLHKPVLIRALQRVWIGKAQKIENQTTLDMMATFGVSVRGGYYISDDQARRAVARCALLTRERGPSIAPPDPSIWSRSDEDLRLSPKPRNMRGN